MMEKYTNNLEVLVDERTNLLIVEKKKTGEPMFSGKLTVIARHCINFFFVGEDRRN